MPFGLSNAPVSFQEFISKIFAWNLDIFVIIYFNNILIYTKDHDQSHVNAIYWVLEKLWKYGFDGNLKQCRFYQNEIRFLGFIILAKDI